MLDVRIVIDGEVVVSRRLNALADRAEDISPAAPHVQREWHAQRARIFRSEGASGGSPWAPLSIWTARSRASQGYPPFHPILQRTKRLMRSLTSAGGDSLLIATPRSIALGSDVEYLRYHKRGTSRMPKRNPVATTADDRHALVRPIRRWVTGHDPGAAVRGRPRP